MNIDFNLKSPAVLAPNKRVSLFLETLRPGIDSSSSESPRWHLLVEGFSLYTENLLCSVATFTNYLS